MAVRDGRVIFANSSARRLFVELAPGTDVWGYFDDRLLAHGTPSVTGAYSSKYGVCSVCAVDMGQLRVLTFSTGGGNTEPALRSLTESVRSGLGTLFASMSLMNDHIPNEYGQVLRYYMAKSDKSACILGRAADNFARVFCGFDMEADPAPLDMEMLVSELVRTVRSLVPASAPNIVFTGMRETVPYMGDGRLIEIMLMQLLSNGIKYSGASCITVSLRRGRDKLTLTVSDDGQGVRPELLPDVFSAYSSSVRFSEPRAGSGLGLGIAQMIASLHGGSAIMESVYGQGAAVTVSLPRRDPERPRKVHLQTAYRNDISVFLVQLSDVIDSEIYEKRWKM